MQGNKNINQRGCHKKRTSGTTNFTSTSKIGVSGILEKKSLDVIIQKHHSYILFVCIMVFLFVAVGYSTERKGNEVVGRWDVTIGEPQENYVSWFEIIEANGQLSGRFVGREGSARPIKTIRFENNELYFSLSRQYESQKEDLIFKGTLKNGNILGETNDEKGNLVKFSAVRSPELPYKENIEWGKPIELMQKDLSKLATKNPDRPYGWKFENGILSNIPPSVDLVTKEKFKDFKLHAEFRIPKRGNSGIYLRGRYEVQISDDQGRDVANNRSTGSIYGFLAPNQNVNKPAGEWNAFDITLNGRWITIEFNGHKVIDKTEIPGITGGALDCQEGEPGPIMLQGDHQAVEYRNIVITPAK